MIVNLLKNNRKGFTLVELMVVTVIMGLVVVAMMGLFTNTQQNASTQEEVANTQQNLRVAMDFMIHDIQMAGFLVPASSNAVGNSPDSLSVVAPADHPAPATYLTLRTASPIQDIARLTTTVTVASPSSTAYEFILANADMVNLFAVGDDVRLIRSPDHNQAIDDTFIVTATSSATPSVHLKGFTAPVVYTSADLLVKIPSFTPPESPVPHPAQVDYCLEADPDAPAILNSNILRRNEGNGFQTVAENIATVDFEYNPPLPANPADARMIRVTITGAALNLTDKQVKSRQITRLISLKNNQ